MTVLGADKINRIHKKRELQTEIAIERLREGKRARARERQRERE